MKSVLVLALSVCVLGMYESVIDLLYETREMNRKYDRAAIGSLEQVQKELGELAQGITAVEVDSFDVSGRSELRISETEDELKDARYFIHNCNKNLKHDSEQLTQIKEKRCFENISFINNLVALKDSEDTIQELKLELEGYFEQKDPVFLEKLFQVISSLNQNTVLTELGYGIYTHPYEFSTEKRNQVDKERTPHALEYSMEKKIENLDSDLGIILDQLHNFVVKSTEELENREIKTAHDIVMWEMELQKESAQLLDEIERKKMQIQKLERDSVRLGRLKDLSTDLWENSKDSREIIQEAIENFGAFENLESERRKHTNEAIEEALYVFETQFPEYAQYISLKKNI